MEKDRLGAFSDGVIAIIITIMVLEFRVPHGTEWIDLQPLLPIFLAYVLSFLYLAIYWNNHHHLMHATDHVDGKVLWANMHLLFWLSMVPFVTAWMAENSFAKIPTALYGIILVMSAIAYFILVRAILAHHDANQALRDVIGKDVKGKLSIVIYAVAIPLALFQAWMGIALYLVVTLVWLIPDRRIEKKIGHR